MNTPINSVGVNGGYAGYVSPQTTKTATQTNQKSISGSGTDEVTLSSNEAVGRRLSELLGFPTLDELSQIQSPGSSGVIRLEDLRAAYAEAFEKFQERLGGLLEEAGVDRSELARLRSDATGRIFVANDHPDKAAIEQLFEDNPELANQFRGLSGLFSLLEAADEHIEFAAAYEQNPDAAVAEFSHLFADTKSPFELLIGPEDMEAASAEE